MDILFIPDTQIHEQVPTEHLTAAGNLIVDRQPDVIVHIGDHWDMPSLSSYEKPGSSFFEGKSYLKDIEAGRRAMIQLLTPLWHYNLQRKAHKKAQYKPDMHFFMGNHENRIQRAIDADPVKLDGVMSFEHFKLEEFGWTVHDYLEVHEIAGVHFSHFFVNPSSLTKSVVSGNIETKLKNLGVSFAMGHQQTMQFGSRYLIDGSIHMGLVAGAFYQHNEGYMGPQGNATHWRGLVYMNNVEDGTYDPEFYTIERLKSIYL